MSDKKNNTELDNSSNGKYGNYNSGNYNSGDYNSGNYNSGDYNYGNYNPGDYNYGYRNSGDHNSGDYNSGKRNSGDYNSGDYNSGNYNSGEYNAGNNNSGNYNSGYYNSGDYNYGFFNTDEPTVRMFNKDTGKKRGEIDIPYIDLQVTKWIPESQMTAQQKKSDKDFYIKGGTLIKLDYKAAWNEVWGNLDEGTKYKFLQLPNFDADIFKEITGIDVGKSNSCAGKVVEIDGKKYRLEECS